MTLELVLFRKGTAGTSFRFHAGECRIGRRADNDIVLDAPVVSGVHAVITETDGTWRLADTSKNGTTVNGAPVKAVALEDKDVIGIEPFRLECSLIRPADADTPGLPPDNVAAVSEIRNTEDGDKIPPARKALYGVLACGMVGLLVYSLFDSGGGNGGVNNDGFVIPAAGGKTMANPSAEELRGTPRTTVADAYKETDAMFKLAESLYNDQSQKQNRYRALLTWREGFERLEAEGRTPEYVGAHRRLMQDAEAYLRDGVQRRFMDAKVLVRQRNYAAAAVLLREITQMIPDQGDERHQQAARLLVKYGR